MSNSSNRLPQLRLVRHPHRAKYSAARILWALTATLLLAACGGGGHSTGDDAASRALGVTPAGKPSHESAREAASAVPRILNPSEELAGFAPDGILRWSAVAGADAYEVWAYEDAGLTRLAEFSKALDSRQYQFTQLAGAKTYHVKLYYRVSGTWRELPAFSLTTATTVTKARLVNSQEELEAFGPNGTLRWTTVEGADVYELWIYRDAKRVAFAETSGPVRVTQYQIATLAPDVTYYVQVYARVNGTFTAGGALELTVTSQLDRARIANPQEELDAFATDGILRWSPVTGATAYELWMFTNPSASEIHESSGSLRERAYRVRTLQPDRTYYAQAYALVNGQWQVGSPVRIATTAQPTRARLTTPQEQLESFPAGGTLRWTEVPGATAYELWIYGNPGLGVAIESGANRDRSYQPQRLCGGGVYYVQVHALVAGQWTVGWATRLDVPAGQGAADCVPPAPQVKLSASRVEVPSGSAVTLSWSSQFASGCAASGAWSGAKALSGQETVGPIDRNSLFSLSCTGPSGTYKAETLVTLAGAAMVWDQSRWDAANWQ